MPGAHHETLQFHHILWGNHEKAGDEIKQGQKDGRQSHLPPAPANGRRKQKEGEIGERRTGIAPRKRN